jgi:hypothetical protein
MSHLNSRVDVQDAGHLQIFLDELPLEKKNSFDVDPIQLVQQDVIDHLIELRDLLDTKIQQMQMRTKNIY